MSFKYQIAAALLAGVAMWLLAGLWHSVLAAHFYAEQTGAGHEGTGVILVAYLVLSSLMVLLYQR